MDNNGFNDWDGFGSDDDLFGDPGPQTFNNTQNNDSFSFNSNSNSFDSNDNSFGSDDDLFDNNQNFNNQNDQMNMSNDDQFSGAFDNTNSQLNTTGQDNGGIKKTSIIAIATGVFIIILVFIFASKVLNNKKSQDSNNIDINTMQNTSSNQNQADTNINNSSVNVDNIMDNQDTTSNKTVITNKADDGYNWTLITDSEDVIFNENYSDAVFTITNIEHKARAVDTNNNLVVITTLHGSISGLSGTYDIDIPYNKGIKLVVGNTFTVHVQLGSYNGKTVVGEIQY